MSKDMTAGGGSTGIAAKYTDMTRVGDLLTTMSETFLDYSASVGGYALNPDVVTSTPFAPVEAAGVAGKLTAAGTGLAANAVELGVRGAFLIGAVEAYKITDSALSAIETGITTTLAFGLGAAAPVIAVVGGAKFLETATYTWVGDNARGLFDPDYQPRGYGEIVGNQGAGMLDWLEDNLGAVDLLTRGAPGLFNGLTFAVPLPARPTTYNQVIEYILTGGALAGLFRDGAGLFRDGDCTVRPTAKSGNTTEVRDLNGAITSLGEIDDFSRDKDGDNTPDYTRIRVIESVGDDGVTRWIVQIPSTKSWDPVAGPVLNDVTACLVEMSDNNSALEAAVVQAMQQAGVPKGAPVMLQGFSLGGITAGHLSSDAGFTSTYDVEAVLTAGSPVARFDIADDIQVLSIEHQDDPVPHLDGYDNPDRLNWTTLTDSTPYVPDDKGEPTGAHNIATYAETATAAQNFDARSVETYLETANRFFGGEQTVNDFRAERVS